jgi:hypothetical protein
MKKKHLFLLCTFALSCTTSNLFAEKISQQTAKLVAKNFFYETSRKVEYENISVSEVYDVKREENSVYYAFNFTDGGFVIVSADDLFTPIIGFSTEGAYSEIDAPENWQWLMNEFAEMIAFGQRQKMSTNPKYAEMWQQLTAEFPSLSRGSREVVVGPLCKAMWNQDAPYNYYAPLSQGGPAGKAYAGCVATAMSIIMHYWRWPATGTGSHTYNPNVGWCNTNFPILSANFGETEYHFNGMANSIKSGLNNPVSILMYHCGVAVDMMFCHSGSGAFSQDVPDVIKNYFRYDERATIYDKNWMSNQAWIDLLKIDLNKGFPLYNSGCSNSGCHAFVCDGYTDDNLFHYNFGWGGSANGYYTVNNVNGFHSSQSAIINFIPDMAQYNSECKEFTLIPFTEGTIADCSGPVENYKPNVSTSWLIDSEAGGDLSKKTTTISWELFDLAKGDYLRIYDGDSETSPLLAEYTAEDQPQTIVATGSKVFIRFTTSPTSETAKGFLLNYKTNSVSSCNGRTTVLTEPEGTFDDGSGENYNYSNSTQCIWKILPENAQSIDITFNYFETEEGNDVVQIFDLVNSKTIAKLSGIFSKGNLPSVTVPSGKARIYFTSNNIINAKGFELNYKATLKPTGIEEQNQAVLALTIFPNPASDNLNLSFSAPHNDDIKIEIYNILGVNIYNENLANFSGNYHKTINIGKLAEGIYFLKIASSTGISVKKIIKN